MAKSHYSGDSPFPPPFSEYPGMTGSSETFPVELTPFPALPAIAAPFMPTPYILKEGAAVYIGESMDCARRMRDRVVAEATPCSGGPFPTITSID
jgi:hypothetical protein